MKALQTNRIIFDIWSLLIIENYIPFEEKKKIFWYIYDVFISFLEK